MLASFLVNFATDGDTNRRKTFQSFMKKSSIVVFNLMPLFDLYMIGGKIIQN